jgi:hypothetical protein
MAKKTKAQLEREIIELKGQLANSYFHASAALKNASVDVMGASGVVLQLTALGGREIIHPVVIRDGLSNETIAALKRDIIRSHADATRFAPKE